MIPDHKKEEFFPVKTYGNIELDKKAADNFPTEVKFDENSKQYSVYEKKAHVATSDIIFWSEEALKTEAQKFCKTLTDEQKDALIFYLLG